MSRVPLAGFIVLCSSPALGELPDFNMYRWKEDYRPLQELSSPSVYESLKYLPLGESGAEPQGYLSVGGSWRERINSYENDRFGLIGEPDGELLLTRLLLHADVRVNSKFRTFIEFGLHPAEDLGLPPGPFDDDELDLTQGFVDYQLEQTRYRLGRQEIKVGSGRLLSLRNGPNLRRAYDGLMVDTIAGAVKLQLFAQSEIEVRPDSFDNRANEDEVVWGVYSTMKITTGNLDFYYIGLDRGDASYDSGTADEKRHSLGTRFFDSSGAFDWDYELIYQFGDFGKQDIEAWSLATNTGYSFSDAAWSPRVSVSVNVASGDRDSEDSTLETFNPLFPNLTYFEEAAILSPQNFYNIEPEFRVRPHEKLSLAFDWNFFWRYRDSDAVYVRGSQPLPDTRSGSNDLVAHVPSISVDYQYNRYLDMDLSYSYFFAGELIEDAGGENVRFIKLEAQWTF